MMIDKTWFKNYQKLETTVNNPDGGKTTVEGIGDVDVEARDTNGVLHKLTFEKSSACTRVQNKLNFGFKFSSKATRIISHKS